MARSGAGTLERVSPPVAARQYLSRRSALELVIFDGLVVTLGLWFTLPAALSLDGFWAQALIVLSPGLLLVARSLVIAMHLPGVFSLAQLDPDIEVVEDTRLEEARHLTWLGLVVLGLTAALAAAVIAAVGVAAVGSQLF